MKTYQIAYELAGKLSSTFSTSMFSATESLQGLNNKLKDINANQKNITGFVKLEEDARKTSVQLTEARKRVLELSKEMQGLENPTKKQSAAFEQAKLKVETLTNKLGTQKQTLSELKNELKTAGVNTSNLSAENEKLAQSAIKAQQAQDKLRDVLSKEQALNAKRSQLQSQIVGTAAVAFSLAQPIREAMEFESAMSDVKKAVDFDTPEQFAQMQKDILAMGRTLPLTHKDLAALIAAGGTAGVASADLAKFAEDAAKMATAFDKLTAEDAGTMMANWRSSFKMSQDEVRALSDQINYLSNVSATDTASLADIVTKVGSLGDVAGLSASTILALGTTMGSVGVKSDVAATGIKNFMLSLVSGEAATKSQEEAFRKLGLSSMQVAEGMQKDSQATVLKVLEGVSKLNKVEQASTLQQLFGKESIGAIAPLLTNLEDLKKNLDSVADSTKYAGSIQKEFDERNKTTANTMQLTKNAVAEVGIKVGTALLPAINNVLTSINPLLVKLSNFISNNETLVATVVGVTAGLVALKVAALALGFAWTFVTGGAVILQKTYLALRSSAILTTIVTKGLAAAQWLWNAAMTANPIGLVVAGIAALIAGGYLLIQNWETVRTRFSEIWESIKLWFTSFSLFESGAKLIQTFTDGIMSFANAPIEAIQNVLAGVREYLPFSDAKVGPLSQLTLSGQKVVDTLREGMLSAQPLTDVTSQKLGTALPGGIEPLGQLSSNGIQSSNASSPMNVTYSPNITIQGTANQADIEKTMISANDDFIAKLKAAQENNRRLSYA